MTLCIYHLSTVFATLFNFFVISLILALRYQLSLDLALKQYIVGKRLFFSISFDSIFTMRGQD